MVCSGPLHLAVRSAMQCYKQQEGLRLIGTVPACDFHINKALLFFLRLLPVFVTLCLTSQSGNYSDIIIACYFHWYFQKWYAKWYSGGQMYRNAAIAYVYKLLLSMSSLIASCSESNPQHQKPKPLATVAIFYVH